MRDRCPPAKPRPGRSKHVLLPGPRVPSEATPRLPSASPRLRAAMEPTAATKFTGRLALLFLLLRLLRGISAAPAGLGVGATRGGGETDALSLSYNFSITSLTRPGQPWCQIQGQINGNKFLSYDCQTKEFKPIGPLGMELKGTAFWGTQREPLEDLVEELRKKLLNIKAEIFTKSGSLTMQGRLMCERGADGHTRESWRFWFNEQLTHLFEPKNRKWTVVPPGGQRFKGTLDNDRELTKLLVRTSNGDCQSWLQQVWERWDEMRETTVPPTMRQDTAPGRAKAIRPGTWIFPLLFSCVVILGIPVGDH
ncbi:UL16-binding protein 3-like [Lutra lutra]|uniref:UL16-binding protein 3-like n=1 Tax=Lutra lutra TaxID=9657 RepID=UPI001FD08ADD|nr:UL16-binding protein 3-like [Lutra lutra]XP_047590438.1 UL16-binding protein 3-like [Lutra lutra]